MLIAVPKEISYGETRVALTPRHTANLCALGIKINIESNAGKNATFDNEEYLKAGAFICQTPEQTYKNADLILKIWAPQKKELEYLCPNQTIVCNAQNLRTLSQLKTFSSAKLNLFALDLIPRISRAQHLDILSSQDTLAGYKATLLGLNISKRTAPLLMTSAGTLTPLKILIIGLGVAGLQAATTAHRMGCQVYAFDKRAETETQAISVGAIFIKKITNDLLASVHLIITNAQIRGSTAPKVLSEKQLSTLPQGCIIIDMAASSGGNIDPNEIKSDTILIRDSHLARCLPYSASILYSGNMYNFCRLSIKNQCFLPDFDDEIIEKTAVCWHGQLKHPYLTGKQK